MKLFGKFLAVFLGSILLIGLGYYAVYHSLCQLLGVTGPVATEFNCRLVEDKLQIKTGKWMEVVKFVPYYDATYQSGCLVIKSRNGCLEVATSPKFQIHWKKLESSRK